MYDITIEKMVQDLLLTITQKIIDLDKILPI